jgi:hypothetical protein
MIMFFHYFRSLFCLLWNIMVFSIGANSWGGHTIVKTISFSIVVSYVLFIVRTSYDIFTHFPPFSGTRFSVWFLLLFVLFFHLLPVVLAMYGVYKVRVNKNYQPFAKIFTQISMFSICICRANHCVWNRMYTWNWWIFRSRWRVRLHWSSSSYISWLITGDFMVTCSTTFALFSF